MNDAVGVGVGWLLHGERGENCMSGDPCLEGLSRNVEVSQLHLGGRKRKPHDHIEADEVGRAWTVVRPDLQKEWEGAEK